MANAKYRSCDHVADAGVYCSSCTAGIMAKDFNPFFGGRRKKLQARSRQGPPSSPLSGSDLFGDGIQDERTMIPALQL